MIEITVHIDKVVVQPDDKLRQSIAAVLQGLRRVEEQNEALRIQGEQFMTQQQEVNAGLDKLDAAYTEIAKDIAELKALAAPALDGGTLERFNAIAAKYEKLGQDTVAGSTSNPTPTGNQV